MGLDHVSPPGLWSTMQGRIGTHLHTGRPAAVRASALARSFLRRLCQYSVEARLPFSLEEPGGLFEGGNGIVEPPGESEYLVAVNPSVAGLVQHPGWLRKLDGFSERRSLRRALPRRASVVAIPPRQSICVITSSAGALLRAVSPCRAPHRSHWPNTGSGLLRRKRSRAPLSRRASCTSSQPAIAAWLLRCSRLRALRLWTGTRHEMKPLLREAALIDQATALLGLTSSPRRSASSSPREALRSRGGRGPRAARVATSASALRRLMLALERRRWRLCRCAFSSACLSPRLSASSAFGE